MPVEFEYNHRRNFEYRSLSSYDERFVCAKPIPHAGRCAQHGNRRLLYCVVVVAVAGPFCLRELPVDGALRQSPDTEPMLSLIHI